jgi:hypothetical protein
VKTNETSDMACEDPGSPVANQPSEGLLEARRELYRVQAEGHSGVGNKDSLTSALAHLGERRKVHPSTKVPGYVSRDGYTFDPGLEEKRIALAEDLIRRTDPGPFEDPNSLALLAYQAASLELALPHRNLSGQEIDWGCSKFLLGTVHSPEMQAQSTTVFSQRLPISQNYTVVVVNSALVEFIYQAARALVAAQHPVCSTVPGTNVTYEFSEQHLKDELARNQEPVERLYRTLEAYFFAGYPRAPDNESPLAEQRIPLTQLVDITERWIIAHEYGHGFAARMGFTARANERDDVNRERAEEFFADDNATILP